MLSTTECRLPQSLSHHLTHVLRLKRGDTLDLVVDGTTLWQVAVTAIKGDTLTFTQNQINEITPEPGPELIVAQGIPKQDKMSDVIRACTEIGVATILPIMTERSISDIADKKDKKQQRWQEVALSASMQSKRAKPSQVESPLRLGELGNWLTANPVDLAIVFWEDEGGTTLKALVNQVPKPSRILYVIGPEGGLSQTEVRTLTALGFRSASMGSTILRTEHAGFAAAAMLRYAFML